MRWIELEKFEVFLFSFPKNFSQKHEGKNRLLGHKSFQSIFFKYFMKFESVLVFKKLEELKISHIVAFIFYSDLAPNKHLKIKDWCGKLPMIYFSQMLFLTSYQMSGVRLSKTWWRRWRAEVRIRISEEWCPVFACACAVGILLQFSSNSSARRVLWMFSSLPVNTVENLSSLSLPNQMS